MFIHFKDKIINSKAITKIDVTKLKDHEEITLHYGPYMEIVNGHEAIDIIQRLCPNYFEGKKFKYIKNAWMIHNLIAHPIMQLCSFARLPKLGIMIHDLTIPEIKKNGL